MAIKKNTLLRLLASVAVTAVVAVGAVTPSLAATTNRAHARTYDARAYDAQASVALPRAEHQRPGGGYFAHGAPDDPPGSAFQSFGNDQAMGMVR
jgi:hypothetical protein